MVGEVVAIGRVNIDVDMQVKNISSSDEHIVSERGRIFFGGSASNFASQCAKLGVKSSLIGCVGHDEYGQLALKELAKAGVDTSCVLTLDDLPTGIFVIIQDSQGKRNIIVEPGANRFLDRRLIEEDSVVDAHVIHVAGAFPMMIDRAVEITSSNGMILSLDPGRAASDLNYDRFLRYVDLLFVNQFELENYFGVEVKKAELMKFAKTFPGVLVVKMGKNGAIATDGFEYNSSRIFEVDVVDTMGAGDAFAAGFVSAWMRTDRIDQSLNFANAVAGLAITQMGAQNGQPSLEEVEALLREHGVSVDSILRTFRKPSKPKRRRRST
ncbi:MAG: carbohydrate kinase family protein [Candidatus Thorarchaeota archaeon]